MNDLTIDGFAEHAERIAQNPDRRQHLVPCPCQECIRENDMAETDEGSGNE